MSSPCLSAGGRAYGFELEIVKSTSISSRASHSSSSPSSTLSESSNSPLAISTRKPRTPRKRPNQTYNEAAAILSTAYPNIFSNSHLLGGSGGGPRKFTKTEDILLLDESSDLLLPFRVFDNSGFLLHQPIPERPIDPKLSNLSSTSSSERSWQNEFRGNSVEFCDEEGEDNLDAESILDEEIEEGIDSIMGNLSVSNKPVDDAGGGGYSPMNRFWYGYHPMGYGYNFSGKFHLRNGVRAMRHVEERNWWDFPVVDMLQISPRLNNGGGGSNSNNQKSSNSKPKAKLNSGEKKKKKVVELKNLAKEKQQSKEEEEEERLELPSSLKKNSGLLLKLNYDTVLDAWSDRGSPFSDDIEGNDDVSARLAQIDLFTESGGLREASVLRYKEKRRTRLFSKKIRYQVRKVNADRRPRMKGRFVRRPNMSSSSQR